MADECFSIQDGSQTCASSCDEAEVQMSSQEQAERLLVDHVTKMRRRRGTIHRKPDSQVNRSVHILGTHCVKIGVFLSFLFEFLYDTRWL